MLFFLKKKDYLPICCFLNEDFFYYYIKYIISVNFYEFND